MKYTDGWNPTMHYTIRFGISMLMRYYLEDTFQMEYPDKVAQIRSEEYYVNMMRDGILRRACKAV